MRKEKGMQHMHFSSLSLSPSLSFLLKRSSFCINISISSDPLLTRFKKIPYTIFPKDTKKIVYITLSVNPLGT
jgi:hypothetical protein